MPYCKNCGTELASGVTFCHLCGANLSEVTTNAPNHNGQQRMAPDNHLTKTIVGMVLCMPFALYGLINAMKVDDLWAQGNKRAAMECAQKANTWGNVSLIMAGVYWLFIILSCIIMAIAANL